MFYYEVSIREMRQDKRNIIIGLCDGDQKKDKILGFGKGAYGY